MSTVTKFIIAYLRQATGPCPVQVKLEWTAADPHAVSATFHTGRSEICDVQWIIARELLAQGLRHPAGIGDVQVCPKDVSPERIVTQTVLKLSSPYGNATFDLVTAKLAGFLRDTDIHIPLGEEPLVSDADLEMFFQEEAA